MYQTAVLASSPSKAPPAVVVTSNDLVGLGNRLPAIATGYVMALFTKRVFLLHSSLLEFMDTPSSSDWQALRGRYSNASACDISWQQLASASIELCGQPEQQDVAGIAQGASQEHNGLVQLVRYSSIDYELPLLQINPFLKPYFQKFFPTGEVFHAAMRFLLHPRPVLQAAMQPYLQDAERCRVGILLRTRKYAGVRPRQFTSIARMLMQGREGTVFVASDANVFARVRQGMPGRHVWWSQYTSDALATASQTKGRNPGTELSAVLGMVLLSKCEQLVLTPASSLGAVAAGFGGIKPVIANFGKHKDPFLNPWFWQSVTSEPCFFKASGMHVDTSAFAATFRNAHPLLLYHNQCHYQQHLRVVPQKGRQASAAGHVADT